MSKKVSNQIASKEDIARQELLELGAVKERQPESLLSS